MQDLNDKVTTGTLQAVEWNEVPSEMQNIIEAFAQVLSSGDLNQLGKSIAAYAASSQWYTGSGAADVYIATKLAGLQAPPDYFTGMIVRFRATVNNTGASTINVNSLGVKNIKREDGTALAAGDIVTTRDSWLRYDGTDFLLTNSSSSDIDASAGVSPGEAIGTLVYVTNNIVSFAPSVGSNLTFNIDGTRLSQSGSLPFILDDFGVGGSHLDTGSEANSTPYYLYIKNNAGVMEAVISATPPDDIGGTKPGYHPSRTGERCVGSIWNDAGGDITPFYMDGKNVRFTSHDSNHEYSLLESASTSWRNLPINIPETALSVSISASALWGATGQGMVCWGVDGALGTLTSAGVNPTASGFEYVLLYGASTGSNDGNGYSVQGNIPIDDKTTPAISYGITRNLASNHFMIINGYTDTWAPR